MKFSLENPNPEEFSNVNKRSDRTFNSFPPANMSPNSTAHPSRRSRSGVQPNHLDQTITQLQTLAQMTTGIYIQDAIMESTAQPFDVMAELLNLDSLKTTDLRSPSDMKNMIAELRDLPNRVTKVDDTEKAFKFLLEVKEKLDTVEQFDKWEFKEALMADLKEAGEKYFEIPLWDKLEHKFSIIEIYSDNIRTYKGDTQRVTVYFDDIKMRSEEVIALTPETLQNMTSLVKLKSGRTLTDYISSLQSLLDMIQSLEDNKSSFSNLNPDPFITDIKTVSTFSKTLSPLLPTLSALHTAFNNSGISRGRTHTPGLQLADLRIIDSFASSYAHNDWITKIINIRKVSEALKPLHPFSKKTEDLSESLNAQKPISMYQMFDNLQKFEVSTMDPKDVITGAVKCVNENDSKMNLVIPDFNPLKESLKSIKSDMKKMRKVLKDVAQFVKSVEIIKLLKGLVKICRKATESLEEATEELEAYEPEKVKKMLKDVEDFKTSFLTPQIAIKENAPTMLDEIPKFLDPFESVLKIRQGILNCLKSLPSGTETLQVISAIQNHRQPIPPTVNEDLEKLPALSKILWEARDQEKMIKDMIERKTEPSEKLKWLGTQSNTVGQSIQGIGIFRDLLAHRKSFEVVQAEAEELEMNSTRFEKTIQGLDVWAAGIPDLKNEEEVVRFAPVFREAVKVEGVENLGEIREKIQKIEGLDSEEKKGVDSLLEALDDLDNVGMKFSGYKKHYEEMVEVLDDLGIFFMEYRFGEREITEVQPGLLEKSWFIALLCISGILTLLGTGLGIWFCRKKKKLCFKDKGKS